MPYLLFLKKQQDLKLSSAANYRWRFMGWYPPSWHLWSSTLSSAYVFWLPVLPRSDCSLSRSVVVQLVERLTWDRRATGSRLTSIIVLCLWAKQISPSLVLVQTRKTRPYITERLFMGCKESNQTFACVLWLSVLQTNWTQIRLLLWKSTLAQLVEC